MSILRVRALAIVRQHIDHPAISKMAVIAPSDHQFQFLLSRREVAIALHHIVKTLFRKAVDDCACLIGFVLLGEKRPDRRNLETKLAGLEDERQPPKVAPLVVAAIVRLVVRVGRRFICSRWGGIVGTFTRPRRAAWPIATPVVISLAPLAAIGCSGIA
jgi:hypothetical protein